MGPCPADDDDDDDADDNRGNGSTKSNISRAIHQGLYLSNLATQIASSLLPHLPVSEAPKVLQQITEAFASIQAHQQELEKEIDEAERRHRNEIGRREKDREKHHKRLEYVLRLYVSMYIGIVLIGSI